MYRELIDRKYIHLLYKVLLYLILLTAESCKQKEKANGKIVTYSSLLRKMVRPDQLTRYPNPGYELLQASSWDRSEKIGPQDPKAWFGNKDYNNWLSKEKIDGRTEYVIMKAKGPGAITRIWAPLVPPLTHRTLRIYLDGNPAPVIKENYQNFIKGSSYVKWPFAFISSDEKDSLYQYDLPVGAPKQMGADFYLPIPFAKSCKVTLDEMPFYYAIDYRMFKKGTRVRSFSKNDFEKNHALVDSVGRELLFGNAITGYVTHKTGIIGARDSVVIPLPMGTYSVQTIRLRINSKGKKQQNRAVVLEADFDGRRTVWSPIAEFFGGGVYAGHHRNYMISVTRDDIMTSNWIMPYKDSGNIILKNYGDVPAKITIKIKTKNYKWNKRSMYFHADWHESAPLGTPPFKDWNIITIKGKGVYVGDVLTVYSKNPEWWGEGDAKIYIDGEKFPSILGTGTEDYYGYAWGMANLFSSPFISMPPRDARGKRNWRGYTTASRIRLLDDIPFMTSFKFDLGARQTVSGTSYSVTAFWYARPDAKDNIEPDKKTILRKLPNFSGFTYKRKPGEKVINPPQEPEKPLGNGAIRYVGNQLDMIAWRNDKVAKPYDMDSNNQLGSAGYYLFGAKRYDYRNFRFTSDSNRTLPNFITHLTMDKIVWNIQDAWLKMPSEYAIRYITGDVEAIENNAKRHLVTFHVTSKVPHSFCLGIMTDNGNSFNKVGDYLRVRSSNGGDSGKVKLAESNRIPDWYFFNLEGLAPGDKITISGYTKSPKDIIALGAITLDTRNQ